MPTRLIKVFLASPGDLCDAREKFLWAIRRLNRLVGRWTGVKFEPLIWEEEVYHSGGRAQDRINEMVDDCDVFFLAMGSRWGQASPEVKPPYTSFTQEEYYRAFHRLYRTRTSPAIYVFFKAPPAHSAEDEQYKKVKLFQEELKNVGVISRTFQGCTRFGELVYGHLLRYLLHPPAPLPGLDDLMEAERQTDDAGVSPEKADRMRKVLDVLLGQDDKPDGPFEHASRNEAATEAELQRRIEQYREQYKTVRDPSLLLKGVDVFIPAGELDEAERLLDSCLALSGRSAPSDPQTARAYASYGVIFRMRGNYALAAQTLTRAYQLSKQHKDYSGMIKSLSELGLVYRAQKQVKLAIETHEQARDMCDRLNRRRDMAMQLGHIAVATLLDNKPQDAKKMLEQAMNVFKSLKTKGDDGEEGIARTCGDLGALTRSQGDLAGSKRWHTKSLKLAERLKIADLIANQRANLGLVAYEDEHFDQARKYWQSALELYDQIGMKADVAWARRQISKLPD